MTGAAHGSEGILDTVERYDAMSGVWARRSPLPFAAYGLGAAVFGCAERCRLIAAGGHTASGFSDLAALYDTRGDSWVLLPPMPVARFALRVLAQPLLSVAYAVGGIELRMPSHASPAAIAMHAKSFGTVYLYNLSSNGWWPVPTDHVWRPVPAFDWRQPRLIPSVAGATFTDIIRRKVPQSRYGSAQQVAPREPTVVTRYVSSAEYERPAPARCQHGRAVDGACISGFGVQRDAYGTELRPEERREVELPRYHLDWDPPLNFSAKVTGDPRTLDLRGMGSGWPGG